MLSLEVGLYHNPQNFKKKIEFVKKYLESLELGAGEIGTKS